MHPSRGEYGCTCVSPQDPRGSRQLLVLAHLYANTDSASLGLLRSALLRKQYSTEAGAAAVAGTTLAGGPSGPTRCDS